MYAHACVRDEGTAEQGRALQRRHDRLLDDLMGIKVLIDLID
jgi:hypothetical protein